MKNSEMVKLIVFGEINSQEIADDMLISLLNDYGFNKTIETLACSEYLKLSNEPNTVSDGNVSLSFANRLKALENIIKNAKNGRYIPPQNNGLDDKYIQKNYTITLT